MPVYVDPLVNWGRRRAPRYFHYKPSCHMYADTVEELHTMASLIGLKRSWFQNDHRLPHYDLVEARRAAAVHNGAIEQTLKQCFQFMAAFKTE